MGTCHSRVAPETTLADFEQFECDEFVHSSMAWVATTLNVDFEPVHYREFRRHISTCSDVVGMTREEMARIITDRFIAKLR